MIQETSSKTSVQDAEIQVANVTTDLDRRCTDSLSLVIPVYNEASIISQFVEMAVRRGLLASVRETIFVDDGSTDSTWEELQRAQARDSRVGVIRNSYNQGIGGAIRAGVIQSVSTWVCWLPVDQQFDFKPLIDSFDGENIVLFSRESQRSRLRDTTTRVWQLMFRHLFHTKLRNQSGIFIMPRAVFLDYPLISTRGVSLGELLVRIERGGHPFKVVPIECSARVGGTSKSFSMAAILRSLREIIGLSLIDPLLFKRPPEATTISRIGVRETQTGLDEQ